MEHGIRSVAFPSISTGVYHFPLQDAAEIAVWTAREFVTQNPEALDTIMWVLFDSGTFEVYQAEIERACAGEV
jgi:O-acetyl-ADP-ribose deacetylase (regulator of RNase III)